MYPRLHRISVLTALLVAAVGNGPCVDALPGVPRGAGQVPGGQLQGSQQAPQALQSNDGQARGQEFCAKNFAGMALADGSQNRAGSCSLTVQGAIPSFNKMVSTIFLSPSDSAQVDRTKNFTVTIKTLNMQLGNFDNPQTQYFMSPQTLTSDGVVIGHQHVVIQRLPDPNPTAPLDPREFDFFRGLDFQPESGNLLSVTVPAGTIKRDGVYRMCTLTGTKGHQPVIMPVAQRGAQDDCIRVEMISGNGSNLVSEQPPVQQGSGSDAIPPSGGAPAPAALAGAGSVPAAATPGTPNLVEVLRDLIEQGIQLLG